jgi:hypothetical protein
MESESAVLPPGNGHVCFIEASGEKQGRVGALTEMYIDRVVRYDHARGGFDKITEERSGAVLYSAPGKAWIDGMEVTM